MKFYQPVLNGRYRIESLQYDTKDEAVQDINSNWKGTGAETYYEVRENKWYVKEPVNS